MISAGNCRGRFDVSRGHNLDAWAYLEEVLRFLGGTELAVESLLPDQWGKSHPESSPCEIENRVDGQRKLQERDDDFREKLTDTVLVLGSFEAAILATVKGLDKVISIKREYVDANRYIAEYDAGVAGSYARAEIATMRRNIAKGRSLRGAIDYATEADTALCNVHERFSTPAQAMEMNASAGATKILSDLTAASDSLITQGYQFDGRYALHCSDQP